MGDIAKVLGRFLTRDIFYILSGLYFYLTSSHVFEFSDKKELYSLGSKPVDLILLIGSAYIVGFAIKEIFAYLHLTHEPHFWTPKKLDLWLFRRHQGKGKEWEPPSRGDFEPNLVYKNISDAGPDVQSRYDRIGENFHAFVTVGCAWTVCSVFLFIHSLVDRPHSGDLILSIVLFVFGVCLIRMSNVFTIRRMEFMDDYKDYIPEVNKKT